MTQNLNSDHLRRIHAVLEPLGIDVAEHQYLITGANSAVYKLICKAPQQLLVAKVGVQPRFRHLDLEQKMLETLNAAVSGLAPVPVAYGEDSQSGLQVLVIGYIEGWHPFKNFEAQLAFMGRTVAACHAIVPPPNLLIHENWQLFVKNRILDVTGIDNPLISRFQKIQDAVLRRAKSKELGHDAKNNRTVIVHGDLIPNNMIMNDISNDKVALAIIDWEGARLDEPEADLCTLFKAYRLRGRSLQQFVDGYGHPINPQRLWFRTMLHYLQVIAWRLRCQIPEASGEARDEFQRECEAEVDYVAEALDLGKDPCLESLEQ